MSGLRPRAVRQGMLVEEVDGEVVVYDERRDIAIRLNRTAAVVWRHCDGTRGVEDLVEVLAGEVGELADTDLVAVTLDELSANGMLEGYPVRAAEDTRLSRRRFIRRVGVVGTAALVLPIVHSIVAPEPAAAQTGTCATCGYCYCSCGSCYC